MIDDERIGKAKKFIHENYYKLIYLEEVASVACLSKYHFCRLFKAETGYSFINYLFIFRIEKSKELLMNKNLTIGHISDVLGFASKSQYHKVFKARVGVTPLKFRKEEISRLSFK